MRRATVAGLASLLLLAAPARPAAAYEINEQLTVFGYSQLWFTLYEQMEEAENRRLLYVACTRAADRLILSGNIKFDFCRW